MRDREAEAVPALVLVRGGGDLATGVVYRLVRAGLPVVVAELEQPLAIRRSVAVAAALFEESVTIEDLTARHITELSEVPDVLTAGEVPVVADPDGDSLAALRPLVVVDARMAKCNLGTLQSDASLVIGLGPGFSAGQDCHAVIETMRGHTLGRVLWHGAAEPDTGQPGPVRGHVGERVLRAPRDGYLTPQVQIGDNVRSGEVIAHVQDAAILASFGGVLRGLIHPSVYVKRGMKVGDVDPRAQRTYCFTISDKALAIGGGVLEAVLSAPQLTAQLDLRQR